MKVKLSWISDLHVLTFWMHQYEAAQSAEHEAAMPGIYLFTRPIWVDAGEGDMLCNSTEDDQCSNNRIFSRFL